MQIQLIKSFSDIPWEEKYPRAKEEHRGKVARVTGSDKKKTLMICLPCGHISSIEGWDITDIDTDTPTAIPSIFCQGEDNKGCWHGYLTKGELRQV